MPNADSEGDLGTLTGLPGDSLSDPQIVWDSDSQHFYYLVLDVSRSGYAFGYSTKPDPTSPNDFCRYILDFGYSGSLFSYLPDYPKMAVTNDFVLIGTNVFFLGSVYVGSDVDWLFKPKDANCPSSLGGGKFTGLKNADGSYTSTPVPAVNADPSATGWIVGSQDVSTVTGTYLSVFTVTKSGANPVLSPPSTVSVPSYSVPASAPQRDTTATLDTMDTRLKHAVAAVDPAVGTAIWTSHTVFGGAGAEERWYEIKTSPSLSIARSGAATSPDLFVFNGGISSDRANDGLGHAGYGGDMVLGFNTSSAAAYPAIQMVSRKGSTSQSGFVLVNQSLGPNVDFSCTPVCRWGDYSGASPDPDVAAGGRVWLSGEWNNPITNGTTPVWQTWNWAAVP